MFIPDSETDFLPIQGPGFFINDLGVIWFSKIFVGMGKIPLWILDPVVIKVLVL
jgi:hypothetical protein